MGQAPVTPGPRRIPAAVLLLGGLLPAQQLVWERTGVPLKYRLGFRTAVIGDVNGDGYSDIVHTMREFTKDWQLWILSGKDGKTLRVNPRHHRKIGYRALTPAGDWNGDGIPDYAANVNDASGTFGRRIVEVFSGKDDRRLWSVRKPLNTDFGQAILGDLDLDGDKRPDLVVTDALTKPLPTVYAYANNGKLLYTVTGTSSLVIGCFRTDEAIGKVGDVNADGAGDYIVGTCRPGKGGAATLLSGKTGKILLVAGDQKLGDNIGKSMDGCGDLDGDGVPDFAVGGSTPFTTGVVLVFSGKTGRVLRRFEGRGFAQSLASRGVDVDRDGVPDIVVGAEDQHALVVLSGRDGAELFRVSSGFTRTAIGVWTVAVGPQPGSPFGLFAVPEGEWGPWCGQKTCEDRGRLRLFRGAPEGLRLYGSACRGTLATTPAIGVRDARGKSIRLHLSRARPGAPATLLLGASNTRWGPLPLPAPLDALGFTGCQLLTSIEWVVPTVTGRTGIGRGYAFVDLPVPLSGTGQRTVYGQWVSLGPGPSLSGGLSGGVALRF